MALDPWYKVALPREEVREGRSFNPDEFAIALEQVVAGTAPADYRDPEAFFARTCFTRALRDHAGMVLRRLAGKTANTSPVMTLVTQFGGGKTHTLTALYHLVTAGEPVRGLEDVAGLLRDAGLTAAPEARVAVFVGNAWDPREGREAPWVDVARQLAGDRGVELLGPSAATTPPGTEALGRVFAAADAPVLVLFDEVLNFVNRYRQMADPFHAFIQNLTVAMTGTTHGAAVISLPRSQTEMSDFDMAWQDKITKVVRRVAKDLLANDETEVSEVVRRRLFDAIGQDRLRKRVSRVYADWCFERRAQLPPQWTLVDSAATEAKAREHLRARFEACYPFHPATLSVFQRKWSALPQFQQTRGTLAMLAQWISWAYREGFRRARLEPLITLGSAPLDVSDFAGVVLGQLGESRLSTAIDADIAGVHAHARALDADSRGAVRDIHRRVGTNDAVRIVGWTGGTGGASAGAALRGSANRRSTRPPSTLRRWRSRNAPTFCGGSERTAIGSATGRPSRRWSTTGARRSTREARSSRPSATWSRRTSTRGATIPRVYFPADARVDSGHPEADARRDGSGAGVDRCRGRRGGQTDCRVDPRPRRVAPAVSGRARLGRQEAGPRTAGPGGAVARMEASRQRDLRGHPGK